MVKAAKSFLILLFNSIKNLNLNLFEEIIDGMNQDFTVETSSFLALVVSFLRFL